MKIVTRAARLTCRHFTGKVEIPKIRCQDFVFIEDQPVLRWGDTTLEPISGCTNVGGTIKPCLMTLTIDGGFSNWIFVDGKAVCLETLTGLTDGTPPGIVEYIVRDPGQHFVDEEAL